MCTHDTYYLVISNKGEFLQTPVKAFSEEIMRKHIFSENFSILSQYVFKRMVIKQY